MDKKILITIAVGLLLGLTIVYGITVISGVQATNYNTGQPALQDVSLNNSSQNVQPANTNAGSGNSSSGMVGGC